MTDEIIIRALRSCGATVIGEDAVRRADITKADLYPLGLTGTANAAKLRQALLRRLGLPTYLSANAMLTALNCLYSLEELKDLLDSMENK